MGGVSAQRGGILVCVKQKTRATMRQVSSSDLKRELEAFEEKYGMSSAQFYEKFQAGAMGDSADVVLWAGTYEWFLKDAKRGDS